MKETNYKQIYQKLTRGLPQKTKNIFERRFGIKRKEAETLESIGKSLGITRERVRQIEKAGFAFVKKQNKETLDKVFGELYSYFNKKGGFKREEIALQELAGEKSQPYVLFLLTLGKQFSRVCEKKDFYSFWSIMESPENKVKETLDLLVSDIEKQGRLLSKKEFSAGFASKQGISEEALLSFLEVSKKIQKNKEGKIGLINWPEIKPRGVRDKAFLVFKKQGKPLHFTKVAELIDKLEYNLPNKKTYPQTVHNELIKDPRFVLVGRGTYALQEWGYSPGTIKDIIVKVLEEKKEPIDKDELVKEVLSQRLVAKSTVLMNLNNKKYFVRNSDGKYILRKTETV
jgi:hypothetical protein